MKKKITWIIALLGICLLIVLGLLIFLNMKSKRSDSDTTLFKKKNVTINYKDTIYLSEYFGENDDYSNTELYTPSGERISMKDGYLYVDMMGTYKLVLFESKIVFSLNAEDVEGPFVMLDEQGTEVALGNSVHITPVVIDNVDSKIDVESLDYTVTKRGEKISVTNNTFIAEELGEYILEFDIADSAGNQARNVTITSVMPEVIVKPVKTRIELSNDIFRGLIDPKKTYTYAMKITRITENGSSEVKGNTITIDKDSIYRIQQTASNEEEQISLDYIYRSDGFMIYDFNNQDIGMLSTMTQSGLTSSKSVNKVAEGDYAVLINASGTMGWNTLTISGLEPNTSYDRISFEVVVKKAPGHTEGDLLLSFYNKMDESGHTVIRNENTKSIATFSNIATDDLGTATVFAYIHLVGNTQYTIDNLVVQKSTAVNVAKGVYMGFSGGAKSSEKENKKTGYSTLHLDVQSEGWSTLKIFATKEAGLKPNTVYSVTVNVACDGVYPAFYEQHEGGNDFILSKPGGEISFVITTDGNGAFEKVWNTIYLNTGQKLSYVEFNSIKITENKGSMYGKGIAIQPYPLNAAALYNVVEKTATSGKYMGKTYTRIEQITREGYTGLSVSASKAAGLKPNTKYTVTVDVVCDGNSPSFYEQHSEGNDFILGNPGGQIKFVITTDKNGAFEKTWDTIYLNVGQGLSYVDFTGISFAENKGSVYGGGITVLPSQLNAAALYTVTEHMISGGQNSGKTYTRIEKITREGYTTLTVSADKTAGLKANTKYTVTLQVVCDGAYPAFYEAKSDEFILAGPGGDITFDIKTDGNGTFEKVWNTIYLNTGQGLTFVDFTAISFAENKGSVYGEGITVSPSQLNAAALYTVTEKQVADGSNKGKTYTCIERITREGYAALTIKARKEAGLAPNTNYIVMVDVSCDGKFPAFYDTKEEFILSNPGGKITFEVRTDKNGEFEKTWDAIYLNTGQGLSYVDFTNIKIVKK